MTTYLKRVGIAFSVLLNVVLGGASNQTFSARNWQWKKASKFNFVWCIDLLLGSDHCVMSWVYWSVRK